MITDPIADMLTRIRNANQALHESVSMPSSGMRREIARILDEEGYIEGYAIAKGDVFDTLTVTLKYSASRERVISGVKRISKPGRRVYARKDRPHKVLGGMGIAILSTSSGVVTGRQAQEKGVGGEVLCYVW
jgi:small subunit ribosomal protein S8